MKLKKSLALVLIVALMAAMLTGCFGIKMEDLAGVWHMEVQDSAEQARELLDSIEAYEEEIALADLNSLKYVKVVEFHEDKTYCYYADAEGTKDFVREFYEGYFAALYEGRAALSEAYGGEDFVSMDEAAFQQYYADLYGYATYTELVDAFTENAYDYAALEEPSETGTFTISGDMIKCTETGNSFDEGMEAMIYGDNNEHLTLTYSNGTENYIRVD